MMKLDIQAETPFAFCPLPGFTGIQWPQWTQPLQPNTWVKLLDLPNPYSFDEALLLCEHSENEWIAWIPDHGETILNLGQFWPIS
jgi:hypothetical protein